MKHIYLILLIIILNNDLTAQFYRFPVLFYPKDHKIKSVEKCEIEYSLEGKSGSKCLQFKYDTEGKLISEDYYYYDLHFGPQKGSINYTYDNNGNLISKNGKNYKELNTYDQRNNLIRTDHFKNDELSSYCKLTYDNYDSLIYTQLFLVDQTPMESTIATYSKTLNCKFEKITSDGKTPFYYKYSQFDSFNKLIKEFNFNSDSTLLSYTFLNYKENKIIEKLTYNPDGLDLRQEFYTYDPRGNLIKELWVQSDSNRKSLFFYGYNDNNKLIKEEYVIELGGATKEFKRLLTYNETGDILTEHYYLGVDPEKLSQKVTYIYEYY